MTTSEHQVVESTVAALDRLGDATNAQTEQILNAARQAATSERIPKHNRHWLWALTSAAVLILVAGVYTGGRNGSEAVAITEQLVADAELYQDMEFYTWLSEELESE